MAKIIDFPYSTEDQIRLGGFTHWTPYENYTCLLTRNKTYQILFDERSSEYYIISDSGDQLFTFNLFIDGKFTQAKRKRPAEASQLESNLQIE